MKKLVIRIPSSQGCVLLSQGGWKGGGKVDTTPFPPTVGLFRLIDH